MRQYGISANHARTLTGELSVADFYERVAHVDPLLAATWVADTLLGELNYRCIDIGILPPERFAELLMLLKSGTITDRAGVEVLRVMLDQGLQGREIEPPAAIVEQQGLAKAAGSAFADAVRDVIGENPQAVKDYRGGRKEAFNYLVGQVMKKTRGRADPKEIRELLKGTLQQGEVE